MQRSFGYSDSDTESWSVDTDTVRDACEMFPELDPATMAAYEIEDEYLGEGAFGYVQKAWSQSANEWVAIKTVVLANRPNTKLECTKLSSEVRALQQANQMCPSAAVQYHDAVLNLLDPREPKIHMVMELVNGPTLEQFWNTSTGLTDDDVCAIFDELAAKLACLHEGCVFHRDIKPNNVMRHPERGWLFVDFGLSCMDAGGACCNVRESDVACGCVQSRVGSIAYVDPWMMRARPNTTRRNLAASDLWSLGATFYILVTGSRSMLPYNMLTAFQLRQSLTRKQVLKLRDHEDLFRLPSAFRVVYPNLDQRLQLVLRIERSKRINPTIRHLDRIEPGSVEEALRIAGDDNLLRGRLLHLHGHPAQGGQKLDLNNYVDTEEFSEEFSE